MSELERWEGRYAIPEYLFGEDANYFLASCKNLLPDSGKTLAVADGEGRNGVWLASLGLSVTSLDFSPTAQEKARALAKRHDVNVEFVQGDVHNWTYPPDTYDVVVEIFTQFSSPDERVLKWNGMKRTLKPGGLLIVQGYTPKQLDHGTGGPKKLENLYTRPLLEDMFGDFTDLNIQEEELHMHEGEGHGGMSAVIGLTGYRPAP